MIRGQFPAHSEMTKLKRWPAVIDNSLNGTLLRVATDGEVVFSTSKVGRDREHHHEYISRHSGDGSHGDHPNWRGESDQNAGSGMGGVQHPHHPGPRIA